MLVFLRREKRVLIVAMWGPFDAAAMDAFYDRLLPQVEGQTMHLVYDLRGVTDFGSAAAVGLQERAEAFVSRFGAQLGPRLAIVGGPGRERTTTELQTLMGGCLQFGIFDNPIEAIAWVQPDEGDG